MTCYRSSRRTASAPLGVTQAALPLMRAQGSGHIMQVSSLGGITAFPATGAYHASKWALEGFFSRCLAPEVASFGIDVTLIERGGYSTDWVGPSAKRSQANPATRPEETRVVVVSGDGDPEPIGDLETK
jgi:NAD(P)-dependent dehydrogenase (short-subunit alcohol dehydrogenase family)